MSCHPRAKAFQAESREFQGAWQVCRITGSLRSAAKDLPDALRRQDAVKMLADAGERIEAFRSFAEVGLGVPVEFLLLHGINIFHFVNDEAYLDEETLSDVMERGSRAVLSTVAECEAEGLHSATVVMHSGLMRACLVALFGLEREDFNRMSVANGLGVIIDFDGLSPVRWTPLQRRA